MVFFYSDVKAPGKFSVMDLDPNACWAKHMENMFFLKFVASNPNSSFLEKRQAEKEIEICSRKLAYWQKKADFSNEKAELVVQALKVQWNSGRRRS